MGREQDGRILLPAVPVTQAMQVRTSSVHHELEHISYIRSDELLES